MSKKKKDELNRLLKIVHTLRKQCPWDKKQTHQSLRPYLVEEAYEVVDAINKKDASELCEELGDLLLQVVLHSEIASEKGKFGFFEVARTISEKMIYRHPQIYKKEKVKGMREHLKNWARLKAEKNPNKGLLQGIPQSLPALQLAQRYGEIAGSVGFDWKKKSDVIKKIKEEIAELQESLSEHSKKEQEMELGDLLFSLVQLARHQKLNCENALRESCKKFKKRFSTMEEAFEKDQVKWSELSIDELEKAWDRAKRRNATPR